jgi:CopG family transcriptional regulator, nickel-responsive regulator
MTTKDKTIRFSVSLPAPMLAELDQRFTAQGYSSRSELVRDMIRAQLVEEAWTGGEEVVGVLTICYDHHRKGVTDRLHTIQHNQFVHILCTTHVHLDHDNCLETIIIRGRPEEINRMSVQIGGLKGVKFAKLSRTASV